MGTLVLTPITKVSVGGDYKAILCSAAPGGTYATGGDTVSFANGPGLDSVKAILDWDVQVGTDNQQGVGAIDPASGLLKYFLATTGAEVTNGRTLTSYANNLCLVMGK